MTTKEKIIETIVSIPEEKHHALLKLVEEFKEKNAASASGGKWDRFFGILNDEDADAMLKVIEEECERIEHY